MLPPDWQARMIDAIRGAAPPDPSWFADGPHLTPEQQIAVYQEQFRLRFLDVLTDNAAGTRALLGEDADATFLDYLQEYPPTHWSLEDVDRTLSTWLAARGAAPDLVAMAALDRAVSMGLIAAEAPPFDPQALAPTTRLSLQPHVTLLTAPASIHRFRSELLSGATPSPLVPGPFRLAIFRKDLDMRHLECEPAEYTLLTAFSAEATIEAAIAETLAEHPDTAVWMHRVGEWFERFSARGLLRPA
jgi:hypothetical protein